jgi:hypothetical protein
VALTVMLGVLAVLAVIYGAMVVGPGLLIVCFIALLLALTEPHYLPTRHRRR